MNKKSKPWDIFNPATVYIDEKKFESKTSNLKKTTTSSSASASSAVVAAAMNVMTSLTHFVYQIVSTNGF
jgi:hypothetical protein